MSNRSISRLDPRIQPLVVSLLDKFNSLNNDGWVAFITDGFRTAQEQDDLYAQGRTKPGPIVTYTRQSNHELGLAIDIAFQKEGKLSYAQIHYDKLVPIAKRLGFSWGGDWKQADKPHFEKLTFETTMKELDMITDQTKIPLGGGWGEIELQAVRSKLNDLSVNNASLALSLRQAKDDLDTEAHANQAQVKALSDSLDSEKKSRLDDMVTIAKALGSEITPNIDSIIRQIAVLGKHDDQLDDSQRLNKNLIQKPFLAVIEDFIIKILKRK